MTTETIHTYCECTQCGKTVPGSLHRCSVDVERLAKFEEIATILRKFLDDEGIQRSWEMKVDDLLREAMEWK